MLLGWNDVPERDPAPLAQVRSLSWFAQYTLPALGTPRHLTDTLNRHTYCFYRKKQIAGGAEGPRAVNRGAVCGVR